jgi:F-type H+-transporting ATPase subunit epsilon
MTAAASIQVNITSAEKEIFAGSASMVFALGALGELGIAAGHAPLLTTLKPGNIRLVLPNQTEEIFYISSGMLEVQPFQVNVLADTALRAHDIDEAAALEVKERAEKMLADKSSDIDMAKATAQLAEAMAQLQAIRKIKKLAK